MSLVLRQVRGEDQPFLWRMLATTANLPPALPPPVEKVHSDPGMAPYLSKWGRPGDSGVVAEIEGELVGAAWFRVFPPEHPGYGFVAADVPEISIGVELGWRSRGIGRALLTALIDGARAGGVPALSLSVDAANVPAMALYRSIGFKAVGGDAGHPTMLLRLLE